MTTIQAIISQITNIVRSLTLLLFAIAMVVFMYGLFNYLVNISDKTKREKSKEFIVYGLLGLFVMVSVWGFVTIVSNSLGLGGAKLIPAIRF
jgi:uncharacterized membrane protein YidH (DUF202 family)